jgi:hypothetical protein
MSPRSTRTRDIDIKRQFINEQLRVSTLAQQYSMNEPAVRAVIRRHVGPAFDGCPQTTVPVLWRLQRAYAELYGENQAIQLLEYFNLLNGRSAEAYVLQEAGISSGLYNTLIQGNKSRGMDLQKMVQIDPKAARFAVQRLEEEGNWALEVQARRIRKYLESEEQIAAPIRRPTISVAQTSNFKEELTTRGSLAPARNTQVKETTLEKAGLKAPIRSAQVSQGTTSDALIGLIAVVGLIALMAWLLMTIG